MGTRWLSESAPRAPSTAYEFAQHHALGSIAQAGLGCARCVEESEQRVCKRVGPLPVEEMPSVSEANERAVFERSAQFLAMRDGDDVIMIAPEERDRRQLAYLFRTLQKVARLATPRDDIAHRSSKGPCTSLCAVEPA